MKKVISILLVVMLVLSIYPVAYGATATATLVAENTTVEPGQTVSIKLRFSNIDMGSGRYSSTNRTVII